jgi:hypothetical protein
MTTARPLAALLALLLAAAPPPAVAQPSNRSLALEGALGAHGRQAFALAAGTWLDGDVEAVARLRLEVAPRTPVRAAAWATAPSLGLRWAPDAGEWRPAAGLEVGARWAPDGRAAMTGGLRAGLEWLAARDVALAGGVGLRWTAGEGAAAEAALGLTLYF